MADILTSGDTGPAITGVLHDKDDTTQLVDLSGTTTVKFQMRRARDKRLMVDGDAVITSISGGVSYTLEANDTAIPGDYVYQWQVTFPDGKKQTTYEPKPLTIRRR